MNGSLEKNIYATAVESILNDNKIQLIKNILSNHDIFINEIKESTMDGKNKNEFFCRILEQTLNHIFAVTSCS